MHAYLSLSKKKNILFAQFSHETANFWGFLALIASQENILLGTVSIFYSFWVCARQISHVRNEGNSGHSTTRDWWIIETSLTLLIYHFSDLHFFQNKLIFLMFRFNIKQKVRRKKFYSWTDSTKPWKLIEICCFPFEIFII